MLKAYRFQFKAMTVPCEFVLYDSSSQRAANLAQNMHASTKKLEKAFNYYSSESWLTTAVNNRKSERVTLPAEYLSIFETVRRLSNSTQGVFDTTVGTLKWASKQSPSTSREELSSKLQYCMGLASWSLEGNELVIPDKRTRFDFGGVIKEHAVDVAAQIAAKSDGGSLITYGGDMYIGGRKPDGNYLRVGIKDPENPSLVLCTLAVENVAITTSGNYERKLKIGGVEGNHIIGLSGPDTENVLSTTVIAPTTLEAGVYSTALMLNPHLKLPDEFQRVIIGKDRKIYSDVMQLGEGSLA